MKAESKRPWSGKLYHSKTNSDDWGYVRDEDGRLILQVQVHATIDEQIEHRDNHTDPTQETVDTIIKSLNREEGPDVYCDEIGVL
mgnify:CR=1 FL=1